MSLVNVDLQRWFGHPLGRSACLCVAPIAVLLHTLPCLGGIRFIPFNSLLQTLRVLRPCLGQRAFLVIDMDLLVDALS